MYDREKELAEVVKKTGLTERQIKDLASIMNQVWQYVADDLFSCIGKSSVPRSEVVEVVTDAGRMEMHLRERNPERRSELLETIGLYYTMDPKKRKHINKYAFPYQKYC